MLTVRALKVQQFSQEAPLKRRNELAHRRRHGHLSADERRRLR